MNPHWTYCPMEGSGAERLFTWNDDLLGV
jgi:hypothetical protein